MAQLQIQDKYWISCYVVHVCKRCRSEKHIVSIWEEETTFLLSFGGKQDLQKLSRSIDDSEGN